jgi:hypothetical protein
VSLIILIFISIQHAFRVAERVAYLGWSDDVVKLEPYEKEFQDLTEVVKICQKVFTDHSKILIRLRQISL